MQTPETQRVEEIRQKLNKVYLRLAYGKSDIETAKKEINEILTQDRASIHTSLVAAVEGKKRPTVCHTLHCLKGKAENHDMCVMNVPAVDLAYNQALEDTLTTINSIFKE